MSAKSDDQPRFSWFRDDIEAKIGFTGARFTSVNSFVWMVLAVVLTVAAYGVMSFWSDSEFAKMFTERGPTQYAVVLFSFWALAILLVKWSKARVQRRPLELTDLVPVQADFVLSTATVGQVLRQLRDACDDPTKFILFNRIELALSNLKNMGQIGDVDDMLQSQASNDEDVMESSYSLVRGLIWAIPVLGFIGTVLGLSSAIGDFGGVLSESTDLSEIKPALQAVTGGLATAFETTFVALVAALCIQLLLTLVRKTEEEILDRCKEYCQRHIVGRLRLTAFDQLE